VFRILEPENFLVVARPVFAARWLALSPQTTISPGNNASIRATVASRDRHLTQSRPQRTRITLLGALYRPRSLAAMNSCLDALAPERIHVPKIIPIVLPP